MGFKTSCLVVLLIIIHTSAEASSEDMAEEGKIRTLLAHLLSGKTTPKDKVEMSQIDSNLELTILKEVVDRLDMCLPKDGSYMIDVDCLSSDKEIIRRVFCKLHFRARNNLLECLGMKNPLFHTFEEEENGFSPFSKVKIRRKKLDVRLLQSIAEVPASSFFEISPSPEPKPTGWPFSEDLSASPTSGVNAPDEKKGKNYKPVIIAVAVTASVTFIVVGLLFLCCNICCKGGRNEDRALLSLNKTDFSAGASPNFFAYGSPFQDGKLELQSNMSTYFEHSCQIESNICTSVRDFDFNEASGCVCGSNIEFNEQAMPTLKPPPGRLNASSFKFPSKVDPPPPPPEQPPRQPAAPSPPQPPATPPVPPPVNVGRPPGPMGKAGPRPPPPPPPKIGGLPPRPPQPISLGFNAARPSKTPSNPAENDSDAPKAKLKPFFWDKVLANPGHSMVWHQIKSGSFQFNEEMIETLFGCTPVDNNKHKPKKDSSSKDPSDYIQIIDLKKAQNLSILLRALNVTEQEICNAVTEGNELHAELIHNLLKMAPTAEEELKLRLFNGEVSQLGPADRFLKALVDIPFAFKQLEALHFMCTLQEDLTTIKGSFTSLEVACQELKNSRLFLKLLEAVLKTGNRMNNGTFRGGAQAFKLDTLLKLSDVKGTDGKTTLLLFVVQEIIRSEGIRDAWDSTKLNDSIDEASVNSEDHYRSLGLQVISCLGNELENVKRAAAIDLEGLRGTIAKLSQDLVKTQEFLNTNMKNIDENNGFYRTLKSFVQNAEVDITTIIEEEKRIMGLVKRTGDYFHGKAREEEGLRLFLIVRDFLIMVDKACKQVRETPIKTHKKAALPCIQGPLSPSLRSDLNQRHFPAIQEQRIDDSSSD